MIAIPVANDQPGVAARVKWLGTGEVLPINRLSAERLRPLLEKVLLQDRYRQRARQLAEAIRTANGVPVATEIIERVLKDKRPVLRAMTATA